MRYYSLVHVADQDLLRELKTLVTRHRRITAALLAHLAEVDARKLYLPAAHPSMFSYCVHELGLSEDAAYKRIQAARTARQFPVIFGAVADGRLHLSAVCRLAPHLTPDNVDALLESAAGKTTTEVEELIASRFPRTELMPMVEAVPATKAMPVDSSSSSADQLATRQVSLSAAKHACAPIGPERFALHVTIGKTTHERLEYARSLLRHRVPDGDLARVLEHVLGLAITQLEKQKFAATEKPRHTSPPYNANGRHIPAHVRRAVWERDGGRCTFESEDGRRCPSRDFLEFDHVLAFALGGRATADNLQLRCRAHNHHAAAQTFGAGFMDRKREEAQRRAKERQERDVTPWLRALRYRADEAKRAAAHCDEAVPGATLEERVRRALAYLRPRVRSSTPTDREAMVPAA